jgi:hypothetical protein
MKFNLNGENKPEFTISSDTDSLFIVLSPILQHLYPNLDIEDMEEVLPKIRPLQKEIGKKLNDYQSVLAHKLLNSKDHYFDLKPEFIIKKAYWSGKRRYAQHIVDQEGIKKDEVIMMGLDIMKSNFPKYFRDFGEKLIKMILFSSPKSEIDKFVLDFKKSIQEVEWKKLLKPVGLKKLDEYIERKAPAGELFSKLALKCPVNTKAAIISNDILRFKKLQKQYNEFVIGDKIYIAMLKNNPYKINVIALNGYNDAPEILEIVNKYIDRDEIFNSVIKNKLENIYMDLGWVLNLNQNINKFFNFS